MTALAYIYPHSDKRGFVCVETPYDDAIVAQFRDMPGCTFNRAARVWEGPADGVGIVMRALEKAEVVVTLTAEQSANIKRSLASPLERTAIAETYQYQREGAARMVAQLRQTGAVLNSDEMGLGKTVQALMAYKELGLEGEGALVLCPAIMVPTWLEQVNQWLGEKALRLDGPKSKKRERAKARWADGKSIGVMSYDSFKAIDIVPNVVILDEIHYLSNPRSRRSKTIAAFLRDSEQPRPYVIGLSGTPMTTRPRDLWHPLNLLWPGYFGSWWSFTKRYAAGQYVNIQGLERPVWNCDGASNLDELGTRLADGGYVIRRLKSEVLELPTRQRIVMPVEIPQRARRAMVIATNLTRSGSNEAVGAALSAVEEYKVKAALELVSTLREQGHSVLVLTLRRATAQQMGEALNAPYVTGDDAAGTRRDKLSAAQVGVATIYSVTLGVTLTNFDTVVFVGLDWVPSTLLQAEGRVHRIGSTKPITYYYLVGLRTVDEAVRSTVIDRLGAFEKVVGASGQGTSEESLLAGALTGGASESELLDQLVQAAYQAQHSWTLKDNEE